MLKIIRARVHPNAQLRRLSFIKEVPFWGCVALYADHSTVAKPPSPKTEDVEQMLKESKQHIMIAIYQVGVAVYGRYADLSSPPVSYLAHISGSIAGVTIGEVLCFKIYTVLYTVLCILYYTVHLWPVSLESLWK